MTSELRFDNPVTLEHLETALPDYGLDVGAQTDPFRQLPLVQFHCAMRDSTRRSIRVRWHMACSNGPVLLVVRKPQERR